MAPASYFQASIRVIRIFGCAVPSVSIDRLGASPGRLVRQVLLENVLLSSLAGGVALLLAVPSGSYCALSPSPAASNPGFTTIPSWRALSRPAVSIWRLTSATLATLGLVMGLTLSYLLAGLVRGLLFGVELTDPATLVAGTGVLVVSTLSAAYPPARRAAIVDPTVPLRQE